MLKHILKKTIIISLILATCMFASCSRGNEHTLHDEIKEFELFIYKYLEGYVDIGSPQYYSMDYIYVPIYLSSDLSKDNIPKTELINLYDGFIDAYNEFIQFNQDYFGQDARLQFDFIDDDSDGSFDVIFTICNYFSVDSEVYINESLCSIDECNLYTAANINRTNSIEYLNLSNAYIEDDKLEVLGALIDNYANLRFVRLSSVCFSDDDLVVLNSKSSTVIFVF